jgi:hypothetical protein
LALKTLRRSKREGPYSDVLRDGEVAAGLVGTVGKRLGPGVVNADEGAAAEALLHAGLERVVVTAEDGLVDIDGAVPLIGTDDIQQVFIIGGELAGILAGDDRIVDVSAGNGFVDIDLRELVYAARAIVTDIEDDVVGDFTLYVEIPLLGVGLMPVGGGAAQRLDAVVCY